MFTDNSQNQAGFHINEDRAIYFSAQYNFTDPQGAALGAVKKRGIRSLWKAHFEVSNGGVNLININEKSILTRFFDTIFGQIPVVGLLSGYLFQPDYKMTRSSGEPVMMLVLLELARG